MNGTCHSLVAGRAIDLLPEDSKKYWQECRILLAEAANFSDIFWPAENSSPKYLKKYPDWKDYVYLPENGEMKMGHHMLQPARTQQQLEFTAGYLFSRILEEMRADNKERAAKFTGILSHMIGEFGQAAHVADPKMLILLFQKDGEASLYHSPIENNPFVTYPEHDYLAHCLGNSEKEASWYFVNRLLRLKDHVSKTIVPIMCATLKHDNAEAAVYGIRNLGESTDIMADLLHTLYTLFCNKKCAAARVSMLELEPEDYLCDGCFNFMPYRNVMPGDKWDEPIRLDGGEGIRSGIALLPEMFPGHSYPRDAFVSYRIPAEVFRSLEFSCGLNHLAPRNEVSAVFKIYLDGENVWTSPELSADSTCIHSSVDLGKAQCVKFYVQDSRMHPEATKWFYPCFFDMTLCR